MGSTDAVFGCGRCRSSLLQEAYRDDREVLGGFHCIKPTNVCTTIRLYNPILALYMLEELVVGVADDRYDFELESPLPPRRGRA